MDNLNLKKKVTNIEVEFQLLVQMALNQRVSWGKLKMFLHELASTYETSRKLNDVLLDELQSLHVKANENESQAQEIVQDDEVMVLFSKQETIEDAILDDNVIQSECQGTSEDSSNEYNSVEYEAVSKSVEGGLESNVSHNLTFEMPLSEDVTEIETGDLRSNNISVKDSMVIEVGKKVYNSDSKKSKKRKEKCNMQSRKVLINGERRFSCETCGQIFTQFGNLQIHERIHTGEKPFECKHCTKRFTTPQSLNTHEKIHTGEKPFECKFCAKRFIQSVERTSHERIHTGEKPYMCKICSKAFSHASSLRQHNKLHTEGKLFDCETCSKKFRRKYELISHLRSHSKEKTFECVHCNASFRHLNSLRYHLKKNHVQK